MVLFRSLPLALAFLLLSNAGCSKSGKSTSTSSTSIGKTTTAADDCEDWKSAYCAIQEECAAATECASSLDPVVCAEEAPVSDCVDDLEAAAAEGCGTRTVGCDPLDIADTTKARTKCAAFQRAYCDWSVSCGIDASFCASQIEVSVPCALVYGVGPTYQSCLDAIPSLVCGSTELPTSCTGVFKL